MRTYDEISIQHIIEEAEINRTTFYKHYANKNSLAAQLIEEFKQQTFIPLLDKRFALSAKEFAQYLPQGLWQIKEELKLLWKIETNRLHLKQDMYQLIKQKYMAEISKGDNSADKATSMDLNLDYQGHMFASIALASLEYDIHHLTNSDPQHILANMKKVFDIITA